MVLAPKVCLSLSLSPCLSVALVLCLAPALDLDLASSAVGCIAGSAGVCQVSAQPNHRHSGARWPMLVYNGSEVSYRGRLFPQESWDASPDSYLLFVSASFY